MFCPECEAENRDGAKFCNECGAALQEHALEGAAAPAEALEASGTPDAVAASEPHASGPLGLDSLPQIDVVGVNVDEDGNPFSSDFDEYGECAYDGQEADDLCSEDADERDDFDFNPIGDGDELPLDGSAAYGEADDGLSCDAGATRRMLPVPDVVPDAGATAPLSAWGAGGTMEMPRIESAGESAHKDFRASDEEKPKRKAGKIVALVLVVLLAAAGIAAAATYRMELWGGKAVPEVVGMTQADAVYLLEGKGFSVSVMEIKSDDTEGLVLLSDPGSGMRAEEGSEVVIHVAVSRTIPEVVGLKQDAALALLTEEGYENVTVTTEKSNEEEGTVLAVSPEAGSKTKSAASVTVTVAQLYTVPNVTGQEASAAQAALEAEGYEVASAVVYTEDVAEGAVISTEPAAGEKLPSGSTVKMLIAKSRASELLDATRNYLVPDSTVKLGGASYLVKSLDGVEYLGNDAVAFTITGQPYTSFLGETVYLSARQVSGTITWDDSNNVVSIQ